MILKVVPVAVIKSDSVDLLRRGKPPALVVVDKKPSNTAGAEVSLREVAFELDCPGLAVATGFHAVHQGADKSFSEIDDVVCEDRRRFGEIAHLVFGRP